MFIVAVDKRPDVFYLIFYLNFYQISA